MDIEHKAEKDLAVDKLRQHEKITRYKPDPTVIRKKGDKEEPLRARSIAYANASAIRRQNFVTSKRFSRAVSRLFGGKQKANNTSFEDQDIKTSTQTMHNDALNSLPNLDFTEPVRELTHAVFVELVQKMVSDKQQNCCTVLKETQMSKSILQKIKNTNIELDKIDTTNAQSKTEYNTQMSLTH
ncbi:unnamed protein product [Mytilus coruscus]|uniref:Uncharacterized protein n=1 Tax=Mytilus coruscus TaxID=42192 RepID=A0A6J8CSB4_MYTCO|nr:unnamed protein product [Mytilus coruscus]